MTRRVLGAGIVLLLMACKPSPTVVPSEPASNNKPDGTTPGDRGPGPIQPEAPEQADAIGQDGDLTDEEEQAGEGEPEEDGQGDGRT